MRIVTIPTNRCSRGWRGRCDRPQVSLGIVESVRILRCGVVILAAGSDAMTRSVAILERCGNFYCVVVRMLDVLRRRLRRWRFGLGWAVFSPLNVAEHKRNTLARLVGSCRLCMYCGLPCARRVLKKSACILG